MKIIGIAGLAKAGKTTAAEAMASALFNASFTPVMERFAGPLKDASQMLGFVKGSEFDAQYREFCQYTGAMARELTPDWWVNMMDARLKAIAAEEAADFGQDHWHERVVLLDDLRFENELELVRRNGGKLLFVSSMSRLPDMDAAWRQHPSEQLARDYEMGLLEDSIFDISVSNNNPREKVQFERTVAALAVNLVTIAGEQTQ